MEVKVKSQNSNTESSTNYIQLIIDKGAKAIKGRYTFQRKILKQQVAPIPTPK